MWMALTWSAAVIGLSAATVSETALPFSISGGRSILTLPGLTVASPTTFWIAARIDSGVAAAGLSVSDEPSPRVAASAADSTRKRRRAGSGAARVVDHGLPPLITQRHQEGDDVLDLLRGQQGLAD